MKTEVKWKFSTPEEFARQWSGQAWEAPPSVMITLPFPGAVLFGAKTFDPDRSVSFYLLHEDARQIGERLIEAAEVAKNAAT